MEAENKIELYRDYLSADAVRKNPNKFVQAVMSDERGVGLVQHDIHRAFQRFIFSHQKGVVEFPREHGKTTQITGACAFMIGRNPNIRIKIVSSADRPAVKKGKAIRELLESRIYRRLFSHIKKGRDWSDRMLTVERTASGLSDGTLECYGLASKSIGGRADVLIFDDPDDESVVTSSVKRQKNWDTVSQTWLPMLTPTGKVFVICTPWHKADTAHHLKEDASWPTLHIPIVGGKSIWPERWGDALLKEKLNDIGSLAFARGYELKPISAETSPIKAEWFRYWTQLPKFIKLGIAVDPAISEHESADFTAIGLLGVTALKQIYLIKLFRKQMSFPATINAIISMAEEAEHKFKMAPMIGVESVAYQRALPQQLRRETKYSIMSLNASSSKFIRASRLAVHIEAGRIFLHGSSETKVHPEQFQVFKECVDYPSGEYDDCVDMLGHGAEIMSLLGSRPSVATSGRR